MCDTRANLAGKTAIVTGGSSGVGLETAKALSKRGARVIIASRNETKLKIARDEIEEVTGNSDVDFRTLDLASLKSVRNFVSETVMMENRLDILINNAGAVGLDDKLTEDGLHLMMQVNYFGAFLLTYLLIPLLKASGHSRVINVSAATMYLGEIDFDHINDVGHWSALGLLSNSKLASSLFTVELSERLKDSSVTANTFDPFLVSDTGILSNLPEYLRHISEVFVGRIGRSKEVVANEIVYFASDEQLSGVSGKHFKFCKEWLNTWLASDKELRRRLWNTSKDLVMISPTEDLDNND